MTLVATLVADPASTRLAETLGRAREALPVERVDVLAGDLAADLVLREGAPEDSGRRLAAALAGLAADSLVQPAAGRRKRLLVADMDSTLIGQECIDELAGALGLKAEVAAITERAMRGELEFAPALRERVKLLEGIDTGTIARLLETTITLNRGARTLVQTMRRHGAYTALVSGGFTAFAGPIAARLGVDAFRANELLHAGGRLTGRVAEPILGRDAKLAFLKTLAETHGLDPSGTLAIGDGANDLAMLQAAGLGIAYRAKPKVAAAARARIDHGDLTAALYFQGYRRGEFADRVP